MSTSSFPKTRTYELRNELARHCLPAANEDPNLKLACINSICALFLLIGVLGARRGEIVSKTVPPLEEIIPVVTEPLALPAQETPEEKPEPKEETPDVKPAVAVSLMAPDIHFSIPTAGALVVPTGLASEPSLQPMTTTARMGAIGSTGAAGDRPQPAYPKLAMEEGEQGTVRLTLSGDEAGNVMVVEIKESSGFPILDRAAVDFVRRHWRLPTGTANRNFETSITYQLQLN